LIILFVLARTNPYTILGVAPYYSMKDIKERYLELLSQHHPENMNVSTDDAYDEDIRSSFEKIQKAYQEIKESRSDENEDEDISWIGYLFAFKKCLWSIFFGIVVVFAIYLIMYMAYEILNFTYRFLVTLIFVFFVTEYFFAHHFENEESQYIFCAALSLVLVIIMHFSKKYLDKRKTIVRRTSSFDLGGPQ